MRDLLLQLPLLTARPGEAIQYEEADPFLLVQIAENAEVAMNTIHLGLSAVGQILARAAPEVETGEISSDATEALGWLLAELGDLRPRRFASPLHAAATPPTLRHQPPGQSPACGHELSQRIPRQFSDRDNKRPACRLFKVG